MAEEQQEPHQANIDLGTLIQVEVGGLNSRLRSHLVGLEPGRFWILRTPDKIVRGDYALAAGDELVLRYLHEGTAFAFRSEILAFINHPERLMFMRPPTEVAEISLRTMERLTALLPAELQVGERRVEGSLENISKNGCRFTARCTSVESAKALLAKEMAATVEFSVTGVGGAQRFPGSIRNIDRSTGGDRIYLGIKFDPFVQESQHQAVDRLLNVG